jgi:predicted SAM-dependent methyltransferase
MTTDVKLHIGGTQRKEGWKILNILPGPDVDIVGTCTDLSMFADASVDQVYASHVLEHIAGNDVYTALNEIFRVLKPGGVLKASVPDLSILCELYLKYMGQPVEQVKITKMIYGGHVDDYDIHHFGYNIQIITSIMAMTGFVRLEQVETLNEFADTSIYKFNDVPISLNFIATK